MQNIRNLGSYRVSDGILAGYEIILRSDIQNYPSEDDFEYLISEDITTIMDMCGQKEVDRKLSGFARRSGFEYYN